MDPLTAAKEKEAHYIPFIGQVQPVAEVVEIARANYGKVPIAVASGGLQAHINEVLVHLGIRQLFSAVVNQRGREAAKTRARHFPGSRAAARCGPAILPRLRGHRPWLAGDSRGWNGRGGCAADEERSDDKTSLTPVTRLSITSHRNRISGCRNRERPTTMGGPGWGAGFFVRGNCPIRISSGFAFAAKLCAFNFPQMSPANARDLELEHCPCPGFPGVNRHICGGFVAPEYFQRVFCW